MKSAGFLISLSLLLGLSPPAFSAEIPQENPPVIVETPRPNETETTSHVASQIETKHLIGSGKSIGDAVETLPGVHLRRFGSAGGLTSLVIRGLGMNYVNLVVDSSPLLQTGVGGIDLNLLPLSHIERIEVYRGGGPIQFDSPIGGVVRIVTRIPQATSEFEGHVGFGSALSRSAHASASGSIASSKLRYHALVNYFGTNGNFDFLNDNNTPYNTDDDFQTERRQNASNTTSARIMLQGDTANKGLWSLSSTGNWKQSQIPGPHLQFGIVPPNANSLDRGITLSGELRNVQNQAGTLKASAHLQLGHSQRQFTSDGALFGFDVRTIKSSLSRADLRGQLSYNPSSSHNFIAAFGLRFETMKQQADVERDVGIAATFDRQEIRPFFGFEFPSNINGELEFIPALRVDTQFSKSSLDDVASSTSISPRLGFILHKPLYRLRGNLGRYHRFATTMERFGDGLRIAPNPTLTPESGFLADLNLTVPIQEALKLDLSGFLTHASGLIAMLPTSQRYIRATNLRDQRIRGLEAHLQARTKWIRGSLAYTYLQADGPNGNHTPGIPNHRIDSSIGFFGQGLQLSYLPSYQSQVFLDPDNQLALPPRLMHNAMVSYQWKPWKLTFSFTGTNLGNAQVAEVQLPNQIRGTVTQADFLGYPLAGRSIFGSVHWKY